MYLPSDDSLLLANVVKSYHGLRALEIGTGSCLVGRTLRKNFEVVVACDIDFSALRYCTTLGRELNLVCCDGAELPFAKKFDLIVSNPPYLPGRKEEDPTIYGGPSGIETTLRFIESAASLLNRGGSMLFVVSSFSDLISLDSRISELKFVKKKIAEKKMFFETISVIEIS